MTVIASSSHFKILLAARRQTVVLSVASEVWFCLTDLQRHVLFDVTPFFKKGCLKNKPHQHTFACRIPYRFPVTKASSWEMTGRISHGLWELPHEESSLPRERPFSSGCRCSYSLADHEVYSFVTWPLPLLFLLILSRFKKVGLRKERLTCNKHKRQQGSV